MIKAVLTAVILMFIITLNQVNAADLLIDQAEDISTNPSNFNGILNGSDNTVQKSLDKIDNITADNLPEGATNKYFNGKTTDNLPEGATNKYLNGKTADNLPEGVTNKYFNGKTTDGLPQGATNKYLNGNSFSGDVTGTYDNTVVGNDSHTHSSSSIGDEYLKNSGGDVGTGNYTFTGQVTVGNGSGNPQLNFLGSTNKYIYYDSSRNALVINAGKVIIE